MIDVNKAIENTVKTGKVLFGAKKAVENTKMGRARLIVVAGNCPREVVEEINYYGKLSEVPVATYRGSSLDLGAVCGKPFPVSALTVREPGDSAILRLGEKPRAPVAEPVETVESEETEESDEMVDETDA